MAKNMKVTREQLADMSRRCLSNNINRTARIITRIFDEKTRKHGYLTTQIQTLFRIAYSEPISINDIARKADLDRTTVVRNCQVLEREELILINEGDDRRYRMVRLTEKGWDTVNGSYAAWREQQSEIERILGKARLGELVEMLRVTGKMLRQ